MTKFQYQIYFPFKNIKQYVFLNSKGRHLVKKKTRDTSFKNNEKCFFFEKKKKKYLQRLRLNSNSSMELQEKQVQKYKNIQEICLERTYS